MKEFLMLCVILSASYIGKAQTVSEPSPSEQKVIGTFHPKGTWLVGAGVTLWGLTAKAGTFAADNVWVGAEAERHRLFSDRDEAGILARYYLGKGKLHGFVGAGVSYGTFTVYSWDIDNYEPPRIYHSPKLNALAGLEVQLSKRISLEGVAKVGRLTKANEYLPSLQASLNFALGK